MIFTSNFQRGVTNIRLAPDEIFTAAACTTHLSNRTAVAFQTLNFAASSDGLIQ
jgi:hypothetical protein